MTITLLVDQFAARPLVRALGWSLLHFCWQGIVLAILLATFLRVLRGRSPQLRYAAACGALVLMLLLPLVTFARLAAAPQVVEIPTSVSNSDRGPIVTGVNETPEPWFEQLTSELDRSMPWIISLWGAGVLLLSVRLNLGLIAARRMKSAAIQPASGELQTLVQQVSCRLGITRTVNLVNSAWVQVPTVVGWLRPAILIPMGCLMGLSTVQVEAILAHELAHIRRHDYLVSIFQSVVETLLFYHPAVWWVSKQARREREHCCDDVAVRISGDSLAYAKALSFLEERRADIPMVALGSNGGVLAMRIRRLLGCKESPAVSRFAAITLSAVIFVAAGLCIGRVVRAASQQTAAESNQNLPAKYQQWLNEDVARIITPEERAAFSQLRSDEERDKFIEQFGLHRAIDVLSDTKGVDLGPYLKTLLKSVKQNWYKSLPENDMSKKGNVSIEFAILKDGKVVSMQWSETSGNAALDGAAWDAITASNPFPPLPSEFTGASLALRIHFYYNVNSSDIPKQK